MGRQAASQEPRHYLHMPLLPLARPPIFRDQRPSDRPQAHPVCAQLPCTCNGRPLLGVPLDVLPCVHLHQPTVAGPNRFRDLQVYVNRGTGYWGPPLRSGAKAEITLSELARPA